MDNFVIMTVGVFRRIPLCVMHMLATICIREALLMK